MGEVPVVCVVWDTVENKLYLARTFLKWKWVLKNMLAPAKPKWPKHHPRMLPQSIPVASGEHVQGFKVKWSTTKIFYTEPVIGSPLNASYVEFFRFVGQFLCPKMCVCSGSTVPHGGVGDCHLAPVPPGVAGDRLPWGRVGQGGGGGQCECLFSGKGGGFNTETFFIFSLPCWPADLWRAGP